MIPKKIHYCWFGGKEKPESFHICLASWKKYLPDYDIIEWNETNFDVNYCEFSRKAALEGKWAFVSDVARIYALQQHGGIYFDTDVEVKNSLTEFLSNPLFMGMENHDHLCTAVIGSVAHHPFLEIIADYYYTLPDFKVITNNYIISNLLKKHYNLSFKDEFLTIEGEIYIYPSHYFSLDIPKNYTAHHFIGTWHTAEKNPYKEHLQLLHYTNEILKLPNAKREFNNIINNQKLISEETLLDLIPFKNILRYSLKKFKNKLIGN